MFCKRVVCALRCCLLAVAIVVSIAPAQAQSKKQLEREKSQLEKEIKQLNGQLAAAKKKSKSSTAQINLLTKKMDERTKLIKNINGQVVLLDRQINSAQDSVRVMRSHIDSMKDEYARVIRSFYTLRYNVNTMGLLFDNKTYNYSYLKLKYFNEYSRYRRFQANHIKQKESELEQAALELQRQKHEKNTLLAQEKKQKDALAREQQQHRKDLDASKRQEKDLSRQISKKEQQKQKLQSQIQQLINEEVARAAKSNTKPTATKPSTGTNPAGGKEKAVPTPSDPVTADFVANKGKLSWPVYYKSATREYGRYTHSSGGQNMNHGIDLSCSPGAAVSAVYKGTVSRVFTTPNGTKGVIIRHGSYMSVYAGLGSVSVSEGATVSARQNIGSVYSSDEPTSDFSFQLWCGKDSLNPRHWLK